jgi:NUMOD3 motif
MNSGFCLCGCGASTSIAKQTNRKLGYVKGQPVRYIVGHCRGFKGRSHSEASKAKVSAANSGERNGSFRHGHWSKGASSPTYVSWLSMKARCTNPGINGYENYGGRGITVCDRWQFVENFLSDLGERPEGMTLDRIDSIRTPCGLSTGLTPVVREGAHTGSFIETSFSAGSSNFSHSSSGRCGSTPGSALSCAPRVC